MKVLQTILNEINEIQVYLEDIYKFIFRPNLYLAKISDENNQEIIKRVLIYAIVFSLIELLLFSNLDNFNYLRIAKISMFETLISLAMFPIIYIQFLMLGVRKKLKLTLVYCLSFRFIFLLIPIIFQALFLNTEIYLLKAITNLTAYLYILYLLFGLPIIYRSTFKRKILALLGSIVNVIILNIISYLILIPFPNDRMKIVEFSLSFDPIRQEVNDMFMEKYNWQADIKFDEFILNNKKFIRENANNEVANDKLVIPKRNKFYNSINESYYLIDSFHLNKNNLINSKKNIKFNTTKNIINLKISDIDNRLLFLTSLLDSNNHEIQFQKLNNLIHRYDETEKKFIEYLSNYLETTSILRNYLLTVYF